MTRPVVLAVWALLAAALVACEALGRAGVTRHGRPLARATDVLDAVASRRRSLVVVFAGWMWLGWHLFAR